MEANSVQGAKLTIEPICHLGDIEYLENVISFWSINANGEPENEISMTDGDFQCYYCVNCGIEFNNFNKVKEHIK